jgi:branched-chain amino acid transport system ATP-binding protein
LLDVHDGEITTGSVVFDGQPIHDEQPTKIVALGIKQVLEGRRIFAEPTVDENLRIGGHVAPRELSKNLDRVYTLFPALAERGKHTAGYLSGGEQQMLAMGRALMSQPRCLLLDEPSLGLAPMVAQQIRDLIVQINADGTTVLLVEQNATMALSIADHGYVMENGKIVMDKPAADLLEDSDVREFYLGLGAEGAVKSFRDVKHYKRRKRWLS